MAFSYREILEANFQRIEEEHAAASAHLENARLSGDAYGVNAAADEILSLDAKRQALAARAQSFVARQQQPQRHPSGLSDQEIEVAKASHSGGTPEQRIQEYAHNKARLQHMRATGQYRDDQGTVSR